MDINQWAFLKKKFVIKGPFLDEWLDPKRDKGAHNFAVF